MFFFSDRLFLCLLRNLMKEIKLSTMVVSSKYILIYIQILLVRLDINLNKLRIYGKRVKKFSQNELFFAIFRDLI